MILTPHVHNERISASYLHDQHSNHSDFELRSLLGN